MASLKRLWDDEANAKPQQKVGPPASGEKEVPLELFNAAIGENLISFGSG